MALVKVGILKISMCRFLFVAHAFLLTLFTYFWNGTGKDLITDVSCSTPYEWKDKTDGEWEFSLTIPKAGSDLFHVSVLVFPNFHF